VPEAFIPADTTKEALKAAPRVCAASLLGLLFILAFHGLSLPVVVISPVAGLMALGFLLAYWRTRIAWLSGMPFLAVLIPCIIGGSLWHIVSGILIASFLQYLPLWLFGKALVSWASVGAANNSFKRNPLRGSA
jgi:hypothetical protein